MMIIMGKIMMVNEQMLHTHTPKSQIKKKARCRRLSSGDDDDYGNKKKTMILVP